jgi:hypothetical protein
MRSSRYGASLPRSPAFMRWPLSVLCIDRGQGQQLCAAAIERGKQHELCDALIEVPCNLVDGGEASSRHTGMKNCGGECSSSMNRTRFGGVGFVFEALAIATFCRKGAHFEIDRGTRRSCPPLHRTARSGKNDHRTRVVRVLSQRGYPSRPARWRGAPSSPECRTRLQRRRFAPGGSRRASVRGDVVAHYRAVEGILPHGFFAKP